MSASSGKRGDPIRFSDHADRLAAWAEAKQRDEAGPRPARPTGPPEDSAAPPAREDAHQRAAREWQRRDDEGIRHRSEASDTSSDEGAHNTGYEVDLQRLEAALVASRQREADERVSRLPPASQLPPVVGIRSPDATRIDDLPSPHAREPSYAPLPPMRERTNHLGGALRLLGACAVAAPIAYFALNYFGAGNELLTVARGWMVSTLETQTAELPPLPATQPEEVPRLLSVQASQPSPPQPPQQPDPSRYQVQSAAPAWPARRETSGIGTASGSAAASRATSSASSPAPSPVLSPPAAPTTYRPAPTLDREDIAVLQKQGDQLISVGDVAAARVLFERAAEAGHGQAAMALGATYDPVVLTKLGVRGIAPDVEKAQHWYQKAREFGSPEAPTWLAKLADR